MALPLNETHDPARRSWVESANAPDGEFPIQNLPFGVFCPAAGMPPRVGVAIGDQILDVAAAGPSLEGLAAEAARAGGAPFLNLIMSLGPPAWSALRLGLSRALSAEQGNKNISQHLTPMAKAEIRLPVAFRNFTDFFASHSSRHQCRPHVPARQSADAELQIRAGRLSQPRLVGARQRHAGEAAARPAQSARNDDVPSYGPSRNLDFELELGAFIGMGNELGTPVPVGKAAEHMFGFCLLNDWSARDIQGWEYQPLGPFLGKNFGTTVSPWVVTAEALAPFRTAAYARPEGDPAPLPYLADADDQANGGARHHARSAILRPRPCARTAPRRARITQTSFAQLYWTVAQMVAHHDQQRLQPRDPAI